MSGRALISYDDITLPYDSPNPDTSHRPPPAKKGKTHASVHWDDPHTASNPHAAHFSTSEYTDPAAKGGRGGSSNGGGGGGGGRSRRGRGRGGRPAESSRDLTHEEIWDDSALIGAWDAAMEEYEAFNGPGKDWKQEPLFTSPLWYNVPPTETHDDYEEEAEEDALETSDPDPQTLLHPEADYWPPGAAGAAVSSGLANSASTSMASQDEAFSRALNAMYWGGYWTAVYHCQRNIPQGNNSPTTDQTVDGTTEDLANRGENDTDGMNTA